METAGREHGGRVELFILFKFKISSSTGEALIHLWICQWPKHLLRMVEREALEFFARVRALCAPRGTSHLD